MGGRVYSSERGFNKETLFYKRGFVNGKLSEVVKLFLFKVSCYKGSGSKRRH